MIGLSAVLAAMLSLPAYVGDRDLNPDEREALYQPIAYEISMVARTNSEGAILVALAWSESKFASAVVSGHCERMPAGQRCDGLRARGIYQIHRAACPSAWAEPIGSTSSLRAETECAIRLLRYNAVRGRDHALTPVHASFAGYGARPWDWTGADVRVRTVKKLLANWGRP